MPAKTTRLTAKAKYRVNVRRKYRFFEAFSILAPNAVRRSEGGSKLRNRPLTESIPL